MRNKPLKLVMDVHGPNLSFHDIDTVEEAVEIVLDKEAELGRELLLTDYGLGTITDKGAEFEVKSWAGPNGETFATMVGRARLERSTDE